MALQALPYVTLQDYLEFESQAEYKSEYYKGRMWPLGGVPFGMAGGRPDHSLIATNLARELGLALKGRCLVYNSDMRLGTGTEGLYTYPDLSAVCGKPEFSPDGNTLLNPCLIVEVLSKTTEARDRGVKFAQYQAIAAFQQYLLVSQTEPRVEIFRRLPNGDWLLQTFTDLNSMAILENPGCSIPLREIYAGVAFEPENPTP